MSALPLVVELALAKQELVPMVLLAELSRHKVVQLTVRLVAQALAPPWEEAFAFKQELMHLLLNLPTQPRLMRGEVREQFVAPLA
jgi:hypothetical protein